MPDFAFLIPIVHPSGRHVHDYAVVEELLQLTTTSLLAQTHRDVAVVVVAHRLPGWAAEADPRLHFLILPDHPLVAPNTFAVGEDKGLKYLLAFEYARRLGCRAVMPMDGDDFMDVHLVEHVLATPPTDEVLLVTRGWFIAMGNDHGRVEVDAVFENIHFHGACGSCRVFWSDPLAEKVAEVTTAPPEVLVDADTRTVTPDAITWAAAVPGHRGERLGLLQVLGTHTRQGHLFTAKPLPGPWAAKGCGHGNHDGVRAGGINWKKVVAVRRRRAVLARLGLPADRRSATRPYPLLLQGLGWSLAVRVARRVRGPRPIRF
jgi:hypothetical protein